MDGKNNMDICPECGCNVAEARKEEKKKQMFEDQYTQQLILIRKKAKRLNTIITATLFMLFSWFIELMLQLNFKEHPESNLFGYSPDPYTRVAIILLYGLVGAWFGTMVKRTPREEKKMWKNFEKRYTPA